MLEQLEPRPVNKYMGYSNLVAHINEKHGVDLRIDDMNPSYQMFYNQLAELPKITREFYYALLSRSTFVPSRETYGVRELLIRRLLNISQTRFKEEFNLLVAYNLAYLMELNEDDDWILLVATFKDEPCLVNMMEFYEVKPFDLKKIFVDLDFTCFS
ncbi:hypothetical protein PMSD_12955 [Paenibacillus macquariensis subsp. defensor]|nr:hypothetical protein PMSD_12955 [Paenibacillus macquariensis subsp. defensor]